MNSLAQLIFREVCSRQLVLLLAAVIALLPFLLPLLPWMKVYDRPTLQVTSALSLSAGFTVALALILGATMIGRDLSEKRLGFYFSRPLSVTALWSGKITGALLVILTVALIVLTPAFLGTLLPGSGAAQGHSLFLELFQSPWTAVLLGGVVLLLGLAHAVSVLARAQSPWIFLPLVIGLGAAVTVWRVAIPQVLLGTTVLISSALLLGGLLLSLFIAGLLQLQLGRADLKRGATVLALVLSAGLLFSTLLHTGYSAWVRDTKPSDLSIIEEGAPGGDGSWVYLAGVVQRGGTSYGQSFLYDTAGGRWLHTGDSLSSASSVAFTPDGTRAVWVRHKAESLGGDLLRQLWTIDLEKEDSKPELVLEVDDWVRSLALSADGDRLALVTGSDLQVYELASGRLLAAARTCKELRYHQLIFLGPDLVRFYRSASRNEVTGMDLGWPEEQVAHGAAVIAELDVARGEFQQTGIIPGGANGLYRASWSRDAARMAIHVKSGETSSVSLHNGRTGELILPLCSGDPFSFRESAKILFDGRVVILRKVDGRSELILFSSEGTEIRAIRISKGMVVLDGETAPGLITLRVLSRENEFSELRWECYFVDLDARHSRLLDREIRPVIGNWHGKSGIFGSFPSPGSPGSQLFIEESRRLVRFDVQTGERTLLLGRENGA